jgi:DNA-binding protein YbaB
MPNFDEILKMAQDAQNELMKAQDSLDSVIVDGASGGGLVKIAPAPRADRFRRHRRKPAQPSEKQMLEDLVAACIERRPQQGDVAPARR